MASLSPTTRAEDLFASAKINYDAVTHLAAFWAQRLEVDHCDAVGEMHVVGAIAAALVGQSDVDDMDAGIALSCGIGMGIGIALAILESPVGDPRERLTAAIMAHQHELHGYAEVARENRAMNATRDAANAAAIAEIRGEIIAQAASFRERIAEVRKSLNLPDEQDEMLRDLDFGGEFEL